jgi:hypothetical protein
MENVTKDGLVYKLKKIKVIIENVTKDGLVYKLKKISQELIQ